MLPAFNNYELLEKWLLLERTSSEGKSISEPTPDKTNSERNVWGESGCCWSCTGATSALVVEESCGSKTKFNVAAASRGNAVETRSILRMAARLVGIFKLQPYLGRAQQKCVSGSSLRFSGRAAVLNGKPRTQPKAYERGLQPKAVWVKQVRSPLPVFAPNRLRGCCSRIRYRTSQPPLSRCRLPR